MPFYRITITDVYGCVKQGVRFDYMENIDHYYQKIQRRAVIALKNTLKAVDVVMLTSNCPEVQIYVQKRTAINSRNMGPSTNIALADPKITEQYKALS